MKNKKSDNLKKTDLPNNFLAEQAVLNILLTNPGLINNVIPLLTINSFYFEPHKLIYTTICELAEELQIDNLNLTIIITNLQDKGRLKKLGVLNVLFLPLVILKIFRIWKIMFN